MIYGQPVTFGGASGEIDINDNGTFDVKKYATANVNVAPVLLWTNASPENSFATQTINVASGYSAYLVELRFSGTNETSKIHFLKVGVAEDVYPVCENPTFVNSRYITANNGNVFFGTGVNTNGQEYDSVAIPTRIWGVKFTL